MPQSQRPQSGIDPIRVATLVVGVLLTIVVTAIVVFVVVDDGDGGAPMASDDRDPAVTSDGEDRDTTSTRRSTTTRWSTTTVTPTTTAPPSTLAPATTLAPTTTAVPPPPSEDDRSRAAAVATVDGALGQCGWTGRGTYVVRAVDFQLWLVETTVDHDGFSDVVQFTVDTATEVPIPVPADQLGAELIGCVQW